MSSIEITTALSDQDREAIISGVVARIEPMLNARPALVPTDTMSAIAGISPATLDRLRRAGIVPSVQIGNRRLYRPEAVIAALEARSEWKRRFGEDEEREADHG